MQSKIPLSKFICTDDQNIIEAMNQIDQNSKGIVFVTDSQNLFIGTVTDGDIRRGVLSKKSLNITLRELVNANSLTASSTDSDETIEQKIKALRPMKNVKIVPILHQGRCVDYYESTPHFFVPISAPALLGNELNYTHDCVSSGWISSQGSYVIRFEKMFSEHYHYRHSLSVMNATCGLELALKSLGLGPGDQVILPSLTFAATINAVIHVGATPVIVDVKNDWCIDPAAIERAITPQTRCIIPVHLYGQVCDMDAIMTIAEKYSLKVVEDCAEAQGAMYRGKYVGSFGDVGCFSFFANKIMTTGEGGMNVTSNEALFAKMKKLRDHGKNPEYLGYYHDEVGYNFRMTNIQAAIGVAQMEKIDSLIADRERIQNYYDKKLKNISTLTAQSQLKQKDVIPVCWLVSYVLDDSLNRDSFVTKLKKIGIDARPFFLPMHQMKIYQEYAKQPCPVSEALGKQGVNLPTSTYMSTQLIDQVVNQIKEILNEVRCG